MKTKRGLPNPKHLQRIIRDVFGISQLRPGQEEAIRSIASGQNTLAIMPTGAGKSLCYQVPGLHLPGTTVIVSPLISLMKDQVDKLESAGLAAAQVNSDLTSREQQESVRELQQGKAQFVFTTAERMTQPEFIATLKRSRIDFIVIDESHCISEWGHDFRPAYLGLGSAIKALGSPPVLALTATATEQVIADIKKQLDLPDLRVINTGIYRPNLHYAVVRATNDDLKRQYLLDHLRNSEASGVVYCATVKTVNQLNKFLSNSEFAVRPYHGRLRAREKEENQDLFMSGKLKAIIATNAFGLGIDKPDIRFVIHYQLPGSLEAYYQESGRAGRDGESASCVLLYQLEDRRTHMFFLGKGNLTIDAVLSVYDALKTLNASREAISVAALEETVMGFGKAKIRVSLGLLKEIGVVREARYARFILVKPHLARREMNELVRECEGRHKEEHHKLERMMLYGQSTLCRWKFLHDYFDEPFPQERCGRCDNCLRPIEAQIGVSETGNVYRAVKQ